MKIKDSVALVTGANRGLGLAFAKALLAAGARKVYAGARDPSTVPALPGLVPVRLDITNADDVAAAARACADVTLLINNAGIAQGASFLSPDGVDAARSQLGPVNTVFANANGVRKAPIKARDDAQTGRLG